MTDTASTASTASPSTASNSAASPTMNAHELTEAIRAKALELGYADCGFASTEDFIEFEVRLSAREHYDRFVSGGFLDAARPMDAIPGVKSIICLVQAFDHILFPETLLPHIARAYQSRLYGGIKPGVNSPEHQQMLDYLDGLGIYAFPTNGFMQVPDRPAAVRAGVVTFGRNNFAYAKDHGSLVILTCIPVDTQLECTSYEQTCDCPPGCRACINACPTHAMDEDGTLDPERCVLYNNMFPNALLSQDVRAQLGARIHGCDACQEVCPRNKQALANGSVKDPVLEKLADVFSLQRVAEMDDVWYEEYLHPVISPYHNEPARHRRNAVIALGNTGDASDLELLAHVAENDADESVRGAATWAIARLNERLG